MVIAAGEIEQPEAVADRERVEVQRCVPGTGVLLPGFVRPVHLPRNDTGQGFQITPRSFRNSDASTHNQA
jgi:hypothetical protein